MIECSAGFCLVATASNTCEAFSNIASPARISKDKTNHLCLDVNQPGSNGVKECLTGNYCIINSGTATAACVLLDSSNSARISREKITSNCLAATTMGTYGSLYCASGFCIDVIN